MPMAPKTDAEKVAKLREMAKDKTLPQEVRNTYLDQAVKLEEKAATKAGVKLAKGGMPMRGERTATNKAKKMAVGGALLDLGKGAVGAAPVRGVVAPPRDKTKPMPVIRDAVMPKPDKTKMGVAPSPAIIARKEQERAMRNQQRTYAAAVAAANKPKMAKGGAVKKAKK